MNDHHTSAIIKNRLCILSLGDSYTFGESVEPNERWPVQLAGLLSQNGYVVEEINIVAKTGWTTNELLQGISHTGINQSYDLVTLLIGVNNQYRGLSKSTYRLEFTSILTQAIAFACNKSYRVLTLSIPDWGVTPYATGFNQINISQDIDEFNLINKEISDLYRGEYLDITAISRQAKGDPSLLAADGLHPSGKMYASWALRALNIVLTMLSTP